MYNRKRTATTNSPQEQFINKIYEEMDSNLAQALKQGMKCATVHVPYPAYNLQECAKVWRERFAAREINVEIIVAENGCESETYNVLVECLF